MCHSHGEFSAKYMQVPKEKSCKEISYIRRISKGHSLFSLEKTWLLEGLTAAPWYPLGRHQEDAAVNGRKTRENKHKLNKRGSHWIDSET